MHRLGLLGLIDPTHLNLVIVQNNFYKGIKSLGQFTLAAFDMNDILLDGNGHTLGHGHRL